VVGVAGCYSGLLLWRCGLSKLHPPPQVCCVEEGFPLWCWYVRRASGSDGGVRVSLIEKNYGKKRNGLVDYGRVKK
jgi:hypothetical protein